MSLYAPGILVLLIQLGFAAHVIRSGRSYIWILPIMFLPLVGCIAYLVIAILPDMARSNTARRLADDMVNTVDPGRGYREKKRQVGLGGAAQAKRGLAAGCIQRGHFRDAIDLYPSALGGGVENEPRVLHWRGCATPPA